MCAVTTAPPHNPPESIDGQTVLLDDRSRHGVLVNGERVGRAVLQNGDTIHLGSVVMRFVEVTETD